MALDGGMKCVKYLLFFFNFIFWLCGLALIVVGVLAMTSIKSIPALSNLAGSGAPIVIIVVGVVIFFIAFFGCCGAWKESHCMVTTFAVLLSIIIVVEIGTAIAAYIYRQKLPGLVNKALMPLIKDYKKNPAFKIDVDDFQTQLHCCGIKNATDWKNFTTDKTSVPDSCCKNITVSCGAKAMNTTKIYTQGCGTLIERELKKHLLWVGVAVLVIAFVEVMGVVFACVLMRGLRKGYEVM